MFESGLITVTLNSLCNPLSHERSSNRLFDVFFAIDPSPSAPPSATRDFRLPTSPDERFAVSPDHSNRADANVVDSCDDSSGSD